MGSCSRTSEFPYITLSLMSHHTATAMPENDVPIVPDVGMFASFDPVALDVACADAVNRQPVNPGSILAEREHCQP